MRSPDAPHSPLHVGISFLFVCLLFKNPVTAAGSGAPTGLDVLVAGVDAVEEGGGGGPYVFCVPPSVG